ncbi:hypothetical protein LINGRAHAP2_LOCUS14822 [Linum grandiflorum]
MENDDILGQIDWDNLEGLLENGSEFDIFHQGPDEAISSLSNSAPDSSSFQMEEIENLLMRDDGPGDIQLDDDFLAQFLVDSPPTPPADASSSPDLDLPNSSSSSHPDSSDKDNDRSVAAGSPHSHLGVEDDDDDTAPNDPVSKKRQRAWIMEEGTQVCSTGDSILALLELLVQPKLPANSALRFTPCQSDEEVMAKQMHAVALLYNYYHRRQHPQLEFMNLESFCKLAVILKPSVLSYMKFTHGSSDTQLANQEEQLSLSEKKIADACNIAMSLDASNVTPIVHDSAISKVAVLLVDSEKQNALLQFGSLTEGVWSAIEKEVEVGKENSSNSMDSNKRRRVLKGPAKREPSTSEAALKKTATLAVNAATGIPEDDLAFLESHIVYSTSKENTATRVFILQCTKADSDTVHPVPIKDLIKSLQGPLFSRCSSQWTTTPVVDYFHLLPFARILADWSNSASRYRFDERE